MLNKLNNFALTLVVDGVDVGQGDDALLQHRLALLFELQLLLLQVLGGLDHEQLLKRSEQVEHVPDIDEIMLLIFQLSVTTHNRCYLGQKPGYKFCNHVNN